MTEAEMRAGIRDVLRSLNAVAEATIRRELAEAINLGQGNGVSSPNGTMFLLLRNGEQMTNRTEESTRTGSVPSDTQEITRFIQTLEDALNKHDPDAFNRNFTKDIAWGNPNGGVVLGWEPLHAVHKRFLEGPLRNSKFRYTVQHAKYLSADIAHAHVRLVRTSADRSVVESDESCLYVLIQRQGTWWVCAGHNTRVQDVQKPG
jgi:uncharacterized protein (TIGR02246 family)